MLFGPLARKDASCHAPALASFSFSPSSSNPHWLCACRESGGHTAWNRWTPRGIRPAACGWTTDPVTFSAGWARHPGRRWLGLAGLRFRFSSIIGLVRFNQVASYCHAWSSSASPSEQWLLASAGYRCNNSARQNWGYSNQEMVMR